MNFTLVRVVMTHEHKLRIHKAHVEPVTLKIRTVNGGRAAADELDDATAVGVEVLAAVRRVRATAPVCRLTQVAVVHT